MVSEVPHIPYVLPIAYKTDDKQPVEMNVLELHIQAYNWLPRPQMLGVSSQQSRRK